MRVPHGCNATNTLSVNVQIPKGVTAVKPRRTPGWKMTINTRKLDTPVTAESGIVRDTEVDSVEWAEGNLPDAEYEDFGLSVKLPFPLADGSKLYFPVIQRCVVGFNNWTDIPVGDAKPRWPAASVTIFANNTLSKFNATWYKEQLAASPSLKSSGIARDLSWLSAASLVLFAF